MIEHVHEWEIRKRNLEPWPYYWFECKHCSVQLSGTSVLARLNATEMLSAKTARNLLESYKTGRINMYFAMTTIRPTLRAYADTLEGK